MPEPTSATSLQVRHERAESARLDNFVDGAFAFAVTLLVISGASLPRDVAALERALRGIPAFAACFAQLAWFWYAHVRWRDSVRLTDPRSLLLSLLLVLLALIFVFPLHLVYAGLANGISRGALSPDVTTFTHEGQGVAALFVVYGLSWACMAGTLAALYRHGARTATWIDRDELVSVRLWGVLWIYVAMVGLISAVLALAVGSRLSGIAGLAYWLLALTGPVAKYYRRHLEATMPT